MKVLFVHHNSGKGGASNSLFHLLPEFKKKGIDIFVVTPPGPVVDLFSNIVNNVFPLKRGQVPNFLTIEGAPYIGVRMLSSFFTNYHVIDEIAEYADKVKPDIIHLNDSGQVFIAKRLKKKGYKIVMHSRSKLSSKLLHWPINFIAETMILKYVDKLIAISQSVKQGFKRVRNIDVIYNPYNVEGLHKPQRRKTDEFNCLFLANFLSFKGIYETIDAAIQLRKEKDIHFFIAGDNVRSDEFFKSIKGRIVSRLGFYPNVKKQVQKAIKKYNLENVHLLGYVDDVPSLVKKMHVSLAPMRLDAPPRSLFEVGMLGVPSILALRNKIEDTIEHGKNGMLIQERDVNALVDAILLLKDNEELRYRMSVNAVEKYRKMHSPQKVADQILEIYNHLVN